MDEFINLTLDNLDNEHICCIIRNKKSHPGIEAKKRWLSERLKEGHVFRKLNAKGVVFIEYAPLEKAWVPIIGDNYYYIYCLWVLGEFKGKGYGKALMEYIINDAKKNKKAGICMLSNVKQKHWLSDSSFAKKYGFKVVDKTVNDYELLSLSFDGTLPKFSSSINNMRIDNEDLTIYYDMQCPYIYQEIETIRSYCKGNNIPLNSIEIDTLNKAKELPCVFNNFAIFYKGKFVTVNLLNINDIKKILEK